MNGLAHILTDLIRFVNGKPLDSSFQRKTGYGTIIAPVSQVR